MVLFQIVWAEKLDKKRCILVKKQKGENNEQITGIF